MAIILKILWSIGMVIWTVIAINRFKWEPLDAPKKLPDRFFFGYFTWFWGTLGVVVLGCRLASAYVIWINPWIGIALGLSMPVILLISIPISWIAMPICALIFGMRNIGKH